MKPLIKPGSRADIDAVRGELHAWFERQPAPAPLIGPVATVAGLLGSAQIGARVHPSIKTELIAAIARLERARAYGGRSQGR